MTDKLRPEKIEYNIGDTGPAGGLVFYINPNYENDHWRYMEAAPDDFPGDNYYSIEWSNDYIVTGATGTAIGTGKSNTHRIVNIHGESNYAAKLCYDLKVGGYSDWFLPSKDELNKLYAMKELGFGNFPTANSIWCPYWSSSEYDAYDAWYQNFSGGVQFSNIKLGLNRVRAVRQIR